MPASAPAAGAELARLTDIHKTYLQGAVAVDALRGIDLTIAPGEMLAICGPSGSGKSTLLNIIGLLDEPTEGSMVLGGQRVMDLTRNARADLRRAALGFIFQSFNLVPVLSALENVLLPLRLRGKLAHGDKARAQQLLSRVGLSAHMGARPDRMSGGQRQRVAIARALIGQPQLVVADEPTANLDSANSMLVMDLLASLRRELGTTFVFSTHDNRILGHMTRIVHLRDGRIAVEDR
ncbi:ABC transporter ATP-binding protein [Massilia horti]|uniref:ABC transporter ATP-binding protein n=2 Tax=Massilia horti TaxID=2562153 RepID=A0A4Y9SUI6_9BURK|nr:ABC transporter ATP-binding protein [Massilia horti]